MRSAEDPLLISILRSALTLGLRSGRDRQDTFVEFGINLGFVDCVRRAAQGALERAIAALGPIEVFSLLLLALPLLALDGQHAVGRRHRYVLLPGSSVVMDVLFSRTSSSGTTMLLAWR